MAKANLHLEHIEDEIFNSGVDGARQSILFLLSLTKMLSSGSKGVKNVTVKWDGAPAVFVGEHPETKEFIVAKKGLFAKKQEYYTSHADIDEKLSGDLAKKFKVCLDNFKDLGIKGILQGDLMFTKGDLETQKINGESYITFGPNTITYAVPSTSKLASTMRKANVGVVWHTTYSGSSLSDMKASFGANISGLKKSSKVWMDNAEYNDVSGTATFNAKDTMEMRRLMSRAGKVFQSISAPQLTKFLNMQESMIAGATYKTYHNSRVRAGDNLLRMNYKNHVNGYFKFAEERLQKEIDKLKSPKGKEAKTKNKDMFLSEIRKALPILTKLVEFQALINYGKTKVLSKLNQANQLTSMFVKKGNGYDVVAPEGFVAIDNNLGGAVKLVDRMEFSLNNFTVQKDWDK